MAKHEKAVQVGIEMQVADIANMENKGIRSNQREEWLIAIHLTAVMITAFLSTVDGRGISLSPVLNVIVSILVFVSAVSVLVIPAAFAICILTSSRPTKIRWLQLSIETVIFAIHLVWLFPAVS
jgi:hypothetical protein